jgi:general secretion pathway protein G
MICANCNNNNVDGAKFCAFCGASLAAKKQPPPFPSEDFYPRAQLITDVVQRPPVITLIAVLQYAASAIMLMGFAGFIFFGIKEQNPIYYIVAAIMVAFSVLHFFAGYGLWNLRPFGRKLQLILAYIGLLSIPIGTIISVLILIYLHKPEVKLLFSGKPSSELQPQEIQLLQKFNKPSTGGGGVVVAVLAGLFVIVTIIGIIAAIAIPNLLNAIQRGKQKRTMADMRSIATACEAYAVDNEMYPDAKSIAALKPFLVPEYIRHMPEKDGWERAFQYQAWKADDTQKGPTSYMIVSLGKDGTADAQNYYEGVTTTSFNNDIVFSDGTFWQYPEYSSP